MKSRRIRNIGLAIISIFITHCLIFSGIPCTYASSFSGTKETEVDDKYLTNLFTPQFPYKAVKVLEDSEWKRHILIEATQKLDAPTLHRFNILLLNRGVSVILDYSYGAGKRWTKRSGFTITKKISDQHDTVEVSQSEIKDKEGFAETSILVEKNIIRFFITKDFGKKWNKVKMIPDKEFEAPEPVLGIYPGAKLIYAEQMSGGSGWYYEYVAKADFNDVAYFFYNNISKFMEKPFSDPYDWITTYKDPYKNLNAITVFEIPTMGQRVDFRISWDGHAIGRVWVGQSRDINLSPYCVIRYVLEKHSVRE